MNALWALWGWLLLNATVCLADARVTLPKLFSDHMVFQQHTAIRIWGKAEPQDTVYVTLGQVTACGIAQPDSSWHASLPSLSAGGPYTLTVFCKGDTIRYEDVMVGEVWVASGQSNMAMTLSATDGAEAEIAQADAPDIRFFQVANDMSGTPLTDIQGDWVRCTPQTAGWFSAAAYYFAKQLHAQKGVAVGIINSSWGGTPIAPWISREMMVSREETRNEALESPSADLHGLYQRYLDTEKQFAESEEGVNKGVHLLSYDDSGWKTSSLPLSASALYGDSTSVYIPGCYIWFRKSFNLAAVGDGAILTFGDTEGKLDVFVNGQSVETTTDADGLRSASIPKRLLHKGENLLALRLLSMWDIGSVADGVSLDIGPENIDMNDGWSYDAGIEPRYPDLPRERNRPAALYNAMIAPLIPYSIRGFLWYQGEANTWRPLDYRFLFPMLINDWRIRWGQGYLPFLFVQLPNFGGNSLAPADDGWAVLRESQAMALSLPATGMAVTIDIGDAEDIHPTNKKDVGLRLYEAARHVAYGEAVAYSGPMYRRMEIVGSSVVVHFDHTDSGLVSRGDQLTGFSIADEDGRFIEAEARIEGNAVVVQHPSIGRPTAVRYGWSANPNCNLYNGAGLPASPFRTDF